MRDLASLPPLQNLPGALEQGADASTPHNITEPVPNEDRADFAKARQIAGPTEHRPAHG
jgi:hypothetical protein